MSSKEVGSVTCTSCHSPHRSAIRTPRQARRPGELKPSTLDASRAEFELCQECHGARGIHTQDLNDISRLTNTANASFHPIEGPAPERSPSVTPEISGQRINCSDCHDNSDPNGPRGPHGSAYRYLLNRNYLTTDGAQESVQAYALCYGCHDRESLLTGPLFPQHASHVDRLRISCATCHNPHGSVENRSLIRFGEETSGGGVSPTLGIGRLAFESFGSGSGACWVSCHGVNHEPAIYGGGAAFVTQTAPGGTLDDVSPALAPEVELRILPRTQRERQRQRPPP